MITVAELSRRKKIIEDKERKELGIIFKKRKQEEINRIVKELEQNPERMSKAFIWESGKSLRERGYVVTQAYPYGWLCAKLLEHNWWVSVP